MTLLVDINDFSEEELRTLVLALQQRLMVESTQREMDSIERDSLRAENAALKKVLADRIVGLLVHPATRRQEARTLMGITKEESSGEDSDSPTTGNDEKEKDKFQA